MIKDLTITHMKKLILTISLITLTYFNFHSQSYIGHTVDNYVGIHGVIYNPANIVNSPFRADINLGSASGFGGSDYYAIDLQNIIKAGEGFDFDNDANRFPTDSNNFFIHTDLVLPSVMFNLSKKSSIGLISRVRGVYNINNINGFLYENLEREFDPNEDFSFNSSNLNSTLHSWGEIGLSYGRIIVDTPKNMLSAGVTLKYLMGAGGLFTNTPGLQGQYTASSENIASQGNLNFGITNGFDNEDIQYDDLTTGFGFDVGMVYEWHPNRTDDNSQFYKDPYKLKIAASVTDIGSITYDKAEVQNFDLNANVNINNYDDIEDFLENNYSSSTTAESLTFELPTALHVLVDYRLAKKWLISAQADLSLVNNTQVLSNRIINHYTLTPRYESKWLSLFLPLSIREYDDFVYGAGLRFGPLSIGSGSLISNLISDESKTTDVFVGLKIPIYR